MPRLEIDAQLDFSELSLPLLRELAVAGDFEAVLSFGLGLSHRADIHTTTPRGQACLILDLS